MTPVGSLEYKAGRWHMPELATHAVMRLKQLFPRIKKADKPPFVFADTLESATDLLWFDSRYPLEMKPMHRMMLEAMKERGERKSETLHRVMSGDYIPEPHAGFREFHLSKGFPIAVRDYQRLAMNMLEMSSNLLLVDDVGLGKTLTGIGCCLIPGALPAVVVCEVHLQKQWAAEIENFTNLRVHQVKYGNAINNKSKVKRILPPADVYIFRYTQLAGWADEFENMGIKLVVYDEIQNLRHGITTERGQGAARLSECAQYKLGLSATPIYNYGIEIYNIMMFVKYELFGAYDDFEREWCNGKAINDSDALVSYLKSEHVFLRRTKHDVGREMPKINTIVQDIEFEESTMRDATAFAKALAIKATTGTFVERGSAARELDMKLRQFTGLAKARAIAAFIRMLVESGQPVIVGLWHREVYAIIMKALEDLNPIMYTGSESPTQKAEAKRKFVDGESDIMLLSLRSGSGLDGLQHRCSTVVIGELDWSPATHHQLIGRIDRDGQTEPVTAFYLTIEEGSDMPMMEMLGLKASHAAAIVDNGSGLQVANSDVTRLQALVAQYLNKKAA